MDLKESLLKLEEEKKRLIREEKEKESQSHTTYTHGDFNYTISTTDSLVRILKTNDKPICRGCLKPIERDFYMCLDLFIFFCSTKCMKGHTEPWLFDARGEHVDWKISEIKT